MADNIALDPDPDAWHQSVVITPLLAAARNTYVTRLRAALADAGLEDLPARGPFILGAIANHGSTLAEAVAGLQVTKQAASQLIDTLVMRGYLERSADPEDRRRISVTLTERGLAAAAETREAIGAVDAELTRRVGAQAVATMRAVLGELVRMGDHSHFADE